MQITGLKKEEEERVFIDLFLILRAILYTFTHWGQPSIFFITEIYPMGSEAYFTVITIFHIKLMFLRFVLVVGCYVAHRL